VFIIAVGSGLFLCGLSIACCVVRRYANQKKALLDSVKKILEEESGYPAEGADGFTIDKNGSVVRRGNMTRG
jgi:hypothetical protein